MFTLYQVVNQSIAESMLDKASVLQTGNANFESFFALKLPYPAVRAYRVQPLRFSGGLYPVPVPTLSSFCSAFSQYQYSVNIAVM